VNAARYFISPNATATKLVKVAAFRQENVVHLEAKPFHLGYGNVDFLYFREVQMAILHVRYAQIGLLDE
jgi:hypothetical protein